MKTLFTTAPVGLDYPTTTDFGKVGELSGGKSVRRVECESRQEQLYLVEGHLAAGEKRWARYLKEKRAYLGRRPTR